MSIRVQPGIEAAAGASRRRRTALELRRTVPGAHRVEAGCGHRLAERSAFPHPAAVAEGSVPGVHQPVRARRLMAEIQAQGSAGIVSISRLEAVPSGSGQLPGVPSEAGMDEVPQQSCRGRQVEEHHGVGEVRRMVHVDPGRDRSRHRQARRRCGGVGPWDCPICHAVRRDALRTAEFISPT